MTGTSSGSGSKQQAPEDLAGAAIEPEDEEGLSAPEVCNAPPMPCSMYTCKSLLLTCFVFDVLLALIALVKQGYQGFSVCPSLTTVVAAQP